MDIFLISIWVLFTLVSLGVAFIFLLATILCVSDSPFREVMISAGVTIVFTCMFITGASQVSKLTRRAHKCCCAELFLAGVKNGVGVTLEAYTNTLHEAGIVMIPIGGRDE